MFYRVDVAAADDVNAIFDAAIERFARFDCAFNDAGITGDVAYTGDSTMPRGRGCC